MGSVTRHTTKKVPIPKLDRSVVRIVRSNPTDLQNLADGELFFDMNTMTLYVNIKDEELKAKRVAHVEEINALSPDCPYYHIPEGWNPYAYRVFPHL
ncbi:unnamed protein product [marine sediment metagenome]|uniref:Uncharacterized protein n=1 Tax=marine sediment metagenome TaxID=412755 RepID=X1AK48_9ZZZZ